MVAIRSKAVGCNLESTRIHSLATAGSFCLGIRVDSLGSDGEFSGIVSDRIEEPSTTAFVVRINGRHAVNHLLLT